MPKTKTITTGTTTSRSELGQLSQPLQSSRKSKKDWRKNIDLSSTESFLTEIRDQESRIIHTGESSGGQVVYKATDSELFVEDRVGRDTYVSRQASTTKRRLTSLAILDQTNGVACMSSRKRSSYEAIKKKQQQKLIKTVLDSENDTVEQRTTAVKQSFDQVFDVWSGSNRPSTLTVDDRDQQNNDWIQETLSKPVKVPKNFRHDLDGSIARSLQAVPVPHPGTSYNPDFNSHDSLLNQAYTLEKKLDEKETMEQERNREFAQRMKQIEQRVAIESRDEKDQKTQPTMSGMIIDVPSQVSGDDDDESDQDDDDDEDDDSKNQSKRKTKQQRAKAKRAADEIATAKARKQAKLERGMVSQLGGKFKRQQAAIAQARQNAIDQRKQNKQNTLATIGFEGKKLGKHKIPTSKIDIQLGDELAENFRTLKPEGNLFRDRYQKLQARAFFEPRVKQQPTKRKFAAKAYETYSYKRFT